MINARTLAIIAALAFVPVAAFGAAAVPPAPVPAAQDAAARMTIPITINGQGPFAFVIDTGADRTVISRTLANQLHLPPGEPVRLHDTAGAAQVQTVRLDTISFGGRAVPGIQAAVLEANNLGAMGMLGIDSLADQQVILDFAANAFSARPSRTNAMAEPAGTIIVYGRRRFGQLVLVDAQANGEPIFVILDTGAQNSLGNQALERLLSSLHNPNSKHDDVISVLGNRTAADLNQIEEIRLGGILLSHVPIAYADLETFRQFGLQHKPAMLLGMDILRLFRRVSVDFLRREAAFTTK